MILEKKPIRRLVGLVPAQMFACGVVFIINDLLRIGVIRSDIFWACLVSLVFLSLIFYNKWTAIAGAIAVAACGVYVWRNWEELYEALYPFAEDVVRYIWTSRGDEVIRLFTAQMLSFGVSIGAFITAGRLRGAWLLALATLGVFITSWYMGTREVFGCMALCASAAAAVSACAFARKLDRDAAKDEPVHVNVVGSEDGADSKEQSEPEEEDKKSKKKKKKKEKDPIGNTELVGSHAAVALLAVPAAIIIAVIGTLFRPVEWSQNLKVQAVEEAVGDAVDSVAGNFDNYSRRTVVFSLNAVGYGSVSELGGPVTLSKSTSMFLSTRDPVQNIRGSVRAVYTGKGWEDGQLEGSYRFASNWWRQEKEDSFDLLRGNVPGQQSRFNRAFGNMVYTVQQYAHYTSMFTLARPERVENTKLTTYFNLQGELFPRTDMPEGSTYMVTGTGQKVMTRTAAKALSELVTFGEPETGEFVDTIYREYLPGGKVELPTGTGESDRRTDSGTAAIGEDEIEVPTYYYQVTETPALEAAANVSTYGGTLYHLFYGYDEEQLALLEKNQEAAWNERQRLSEEYEDEEIVNAMMREFLEDQVEPQPTAFWLSEEELLDEYGIYGSSLEAVLTNLAVKDKFRQDETTREFIRHRYWVSTSDAQSYLNLYLGLTIPPEEEREPDAYYLESDQAQWFSLVGSERVVAVQRFNFTPQPIEGMEGFYSSTAYSEPSYNLAAICQGMGFARLEYGGMQRYMPYIGENFKDVVLARYLDTIEEGAEVNIFDLALELAKAIDESCTYTLNPTVVPKDVDFVNWFLCTREGYCTYYATAMAVLVRSYGIPSRYVEGYSIPGAERTDGGVYILTGENAHAWPEMFFDSIGWVTIDPLALGLLNVEEEEIEDDYQPPVAETPTPTHEIVEPTWRDNLGITEAPKEVSFPYWIIPIIAVVLIAGLFLGTRALVLRHRSLKQLRKRYGDRGAVMELWAESVKLLGLVEPLCVRAEGETASEYAARVRRIIYIEGAPFDKVAETAERAWYAANEPSESEMAMSEAFVKGLRKLMFRRRPYGISWARLRYIKKKREESHK